MEWVVSNNEDGLQGHSVLAKKLVEAGGAMQIGWKDNSAMCKLIGKVLRRFPRFREVSPARAYETFRADLLNVMPGSKRDLVHFIWGDQVITRSLYPERCVFTLHQPHESWSEAVWKRLSKVQGILTMDQRECDVIIEHAPHTAVKFIHLGIDVDFWTPDSGLWRIGEKKICVVGHHMRNFDMLERVSNELLRRHSDLVIRLLINPDYEVPARVAKKLLSDRIKLVRNLSAKELRKFYQESWLFFTPFNNVTSSQAIVEAMACGTPVFTTRVGGMESYAQNDSIVLVDNDDDCSMIEQINRCLDSIECRQELSRRARSQALDRFAWNHVVKAHYEFYDSLSER